MQQLPQLHDQGGCERSPQKEVRKARQMVSPQERLQDESTQAVAGLLASAFSRTYEFADSTDASSGERLFGGSLPADSVARHMAAAAPAAEAAFRLYLRHAAAAHDQYAAR